MSSTYDYRKMKGLCVYCGTAKARPGYTRCQKCAQLEHEYRAERYYRGRDRVDRRGGKTKYLFRLFAGDTEIFSGTVLDLVREYGGEAAAWHHYADGQVRYKGVYRVTKELIKKENGKE